LSENQDDGKKIIQKLFSFGQAFSYFLESKNFNAFEEIEGFNELENKTRAILKNYNANKVKILESNFIKAGKCLSKYLNKNQVKISKCALDSKYCDFGKVRMVFVLVRCIPQALDDFLIKHFDNEVQALISG
jgi:hypothetical protein